MDDTIFKNKAMCSWITPDGEVHEVFERENHDNELPKSYNTIRKAEKVCIRISCGYGWNAGISQIQLPNKITVNQKNILIRLDSEIECFRKINLYYFVGNSSRKTNYNDLIRTYNEN